MNTVSYIRWFGEIGIDDVPLVGGKNASLGEMYQNLTAEGVRVPNGFAVTAEAYRYVLDHNNAWQPLHAALDGLDPDNIVDLQSRGAQARAVMHGCVLPDDLRAAILQAYARLEQEYGATISLAVRSSATAVFSPVAWCAGNNYINLNISRAAALLDAYKRCLATNFTDRSIHYKYDNHFDYYKVYLSVVVMKMVRSDIGASGVMFSLDTETGFKDVVFINAALGLGENVVQGTVDPDSFHVHKPSFVQGYRAVLKRRLGSKEKKMIFTETLNTGNIAVEYTANIETSQAERTRFCISDADIMVLADYAIKVENHYSAKAGFYKPMDMEWAKDGIDGHLYMVQARQETVASQKKGNVFEIYRLKHRSNVLLRGRAVGTRIGTGRVRLIDDVRGLGEFRPGEVLVADTTTPDWEPVMKIAAAIITNRGGRTCHAAIVSRELGIPAIVGTERATSALKTGDEVSVSCAEGETGVAFEGILDFEIQQTDLSQLGWTKAAIMMNLGDPDQAFSLAALPVDGIGLARMEFIINESIKVHPMAIKHPEAVDAATREQIAAISAAYDSAEDFFVKTLA